MKILVACEQSIETRWDMIIAFPGIAKAMAEQWAGGMVAEEER